MGKVNVKCNSCGADDYSVIFPEGKAQIHRIVKCNQCGLMFANPQTTHTIDGKVSMDEGEIKDRVALEKELKDFIPNKNQYLKKQYIQQRDYLKVLDYFEERERGILLDIGSYTGVFLNSAKERGWTPLGIEPMSLPRIYSIREFGLEVYPMAFEKAQIEGACIDIIVSFHVIEHVYDPMEFILKAYKVLKKGGVLVLETPTYDSFWFKLLRHRERSVRCNGHVYFFTKSSLRNLIEKAGFTVIKHDNVGRTMTLDRLFHNIGIITGKKEFLNKFTRTLGFQKFSLYLNMRDMQRIYCEKN
jgi:2-polyprenyl-3-methyl-5-hydroxy-6-metoxy-1,4-benzoquinol methylase